MRSGHPSVQAASSGQGAGVKNCYDSITKFTGISQEICLTNALLKPGQVIVSCQVLTMCIKSH
jgi:hypothetical protein